MCGASRGLFLVLYNLPLGQKIVPIPYLCTRSGKLTYHICLPTTHKFIMICSVTEISADNSEHMRRVRWKCPTGKWRIGKCRINYLRGKCSNNVGNKWKKRTYNIRLLTMLWDPALIHSHYYVVVIVKECITAIHGKFKVNQGRCIFV